MDNKVFDITDAWCNHEDAIYMFCPPKVNKKH